jgi:hypothetical protein
LRAFLHLADSKPEASEDDTFWLRKLKFTHLDETGRCRAIVSHGIRMEKPILFLSSGQRVPKDSLPAPAKVRLDTIEQGWARESRYGVVAV